MGRVAALSLEPPAGPGEGRICKAEYAATGRFIWRKALQPIAVGMKHRPETAWLADLPAHAVLDPKAETLKVRGMARNRHLALSLADAGMARLVTFLTYKADWRGRRLIKINRWFPGSQTCCRCGASHPQMEKLSRDMMLCACGNRMGRDRNAAANHYSYLEEPGKRGFAPTHVEIGDQGHAPVPVGEARIRTKTVIDHESQ